MTGECQERAPVELAGGAVLVRRGEGVAEVIFNRPERHNAFTMAMYDALEAACVELAADTDVRAVVLRGAGGRAFAAGTEIGEFVAMAGGAAGVAYEARIRRLLTTLAEMPQVTVAVVDGVCVGGGLAVATHCDLRLCSTGSRFGYPIARTLGNALSAPVLYRCVAVFGEALTREMLLTARLVDADRAYAVGAVTAVAPPGGLDDEVGRVLDGIRASAAQTLATTKRQLRHLAGAAPYPAADDDLLAQVYGSADFREGVRAFMAGEPPRFGQS